MAGMTENRTYLRGIGFSVLLHLGLLGVALLLWMRPVPEPEPEKLLWEVDMFRSDESSAPDLTTPQPSGPEPESTAEPVMEEVDQPAAAPGADLGSLGAPAFGTPSIEAPGSVSAGTTAIPATSIGGTNLGAAWGGHGGSGPALGGMPPALGGSGSLIPTVRVPPTYPTEARKKKVEGWVKVEMTVTESGSVTDVRVREAKPPGIFDQAALAAVAQWKFRPYMEDGKPQRHRAAQTVRFELQD